MTDEDQIRELQARWAECDADQDADGLTRLFVEESLVRGAALASQDLWAREPMECTA